MKNVLRLAYIVFLLTETNSLFWRRRRRRRSPPPPCSPVNCRVGSWTIWSSCSQLCGSGGRQVRTRSVIQRQSCGGTCNFHLREEQSCSIGCKNGGTPHSGGCTCQAGYTGDCCGAGNLLLLQLSIWRSRRNSTLFNSHITSSTLSIKQNTVTIIY